MLPGTVRLHETRGDALRVAMVSHSVYERDNRVMRYAQALSHRGDEVHVLSLSPGNGAAAYTQIDGVHVHRLCERKTGQRTSVLSSVRQTLHFGLLASLQLRRLRKKRDRGQRPWDLLHIHNLPDVLIQTAIPYRRRGAGVILDIHDLMPEFFSARFSGAASQRCVRWLLSAERWAASQADHVLLASPLWPDRYQQRIALMKTKPPACSVFINYVEQQRFPPRTPRQSSALGTPIRLIFPGGLHQHQGVDVAIEAVSKLRQRNYPIQLELYGQGPEEQSLRQLTNRLGLDTCIRFHGVANIEQIAHAMSSCDIGIVPKRADGFGNEAVSTKILEFMSVGLPVVASATAVEQFLFSPKDIEFVTPADPHALANGIERVVTDTARRQHLIARGHQLAQLWSWQRHQERYLALVDELALRRRTL